MKLLFISLIAGLFANVTWLGDYSQATNEAAKTHKLILINFSGSDWCGPCIRERKEILENDAFTNYAADHLVLVRADFPRQKKNQLSKEQVKLNEALADKFNPDGKFPYTILVDEHGKVLKDWDGFPNESPDQFVDQIAAVANTGK
ncbi:thioredoxin family protein [Mucilaginibacter sp. AW1-7]|jgi:thioredoxin-related protein|uniref:thioredoxin family protein n=1 Tax=unclassified Mucilaginibacter TaxID=2617802 RepID=UPI0023661057|nr:thioredoxin family protein [Mucilaginibacter sp. KACC 22773]WDF78670.1 thioredoxin family protein [Mucilaginibacter sp. KACC 22773]